MQIWGALAGLCALALTHGCFKPTYGDNCKILCNPQGSHHCPGDLQCVNNVCAAPGTTCPGVMDASYDTSDGNPNDGDTSAGPPERICHRGSCLTLPPAVRAGLVLLLWPSILPALGATVPIWRDLSGHANDAQALYPSALPHVVTDGVQLDASQFGSGFVVGNSESLNLGSRDFAVIVVAGLAAANAPVTIFRQGGGRVVSAPQIAISWALTSAVNGRAQAIVNSTVVPSSLDISQPSVTIYGVRRIGDHVEMRLSGVVVGSGDLPMSGESTTSGEDVYVGVGSLVGTPVDTIAAVIALAGPVAALDLGEIEAFLRDLFVPRP